MNLTAQRLEATLGPWRGPALLEVFCEALTRSLDTLLSIAYDQPDGVPGWAVVMDPSTAPDAYLPWLGQFVGVVVNSLASTEEQRASILGEQGFRRGTVDNMRAMVQACLTGDKQFAIVERDTSPYHATVHTYLRQTPDQSKVLAAIVASKPAGLIIDYVPLHAASFLEVRASKVDQTFSGRQAAYPLFSDVLAYVP